MTKVVIQHEPTGEQRTVEMLPPFQPQPITWWAFPKIPSVQRDWFVVAFETDGVRMNTGSTKLRVEFLTMPDPLVSASGETGPRPAGAQE